MTYQFPGSNWFNLVLPQPQAGLIDFYSQIELCVPCDFSSIFYLGTVWCEILPSDVFCVGATPWCCMVQWLGVFVADDGMSAGWGIMIYQKWYTLCFLYLFFLFPLVFQGWRVKRRLHVKSVILVLILRSKQLHLCAAQCCISPVWVWPQPLKLSYNSCPRREDTLDWTLLNIYLIKINHIRYCLCLWLTDKVTETQRTWD